MASPGWAQADGDDLSELSVNYVYASQLGIGGYEVGGLSAQVYEIPLSMTVPLEEREGWELKLKLPIDLAIFELDLEIPQAGKATIDQYALAVVPGAELAIPAAENWTLRPFVDLGVAAVIKTEVNAPPGAEVDASDRPSLIYTTGVRSLFEQHWEDFTFSLGNGLIYAGNTNFAGVDESYLAIETGVEARRPLGFTFDHLEPDLGLYFIHYYYPNPLRFSRFEQEALRVDNQFEFGFSVGSATPFRLWVLNNPRIGAGYIFGDGLTVFRINFGFPF